ncbi:uncharacterized protein A1O9_04965, partial [Exophiala aquamarina CBS 119918]
TPAHIRQVRGCNGTNSIYRDEFVKVQSLYRDCKYKQCATLCEDLLGLKVSATLGPLHPLHEGFLWYYHATCYECMGLAAHSFSKNKLHFLELARDGLDTTLRVLPLAYATSARGIYEEHEESPLPTTIPTKAAAYRYNIIYQPETPSVRPSTAPISTSPDSTYSVHSHTSEPLSVFDGEESPAPYQTYMPPPNPTKQEDPPGWTPLVVLDSTHKDRLIKSLSTMHKLADGLVPSPLFSRSRRNTSTYKEAHGEGDGTPRPLPPLPFNHTVKFQIQGDRIVQIPNSTPVRKTAVQTLISLFEGSLPLPLPHSPSSTNSSWSISPFTPRFTQIKEAFSPVPHNHHLEAYLDSADLSCYNASLAEFRHQLRKQISFISDQIHQVQAAQADHAKSKILTQNPLASFWSFEQASTSSSDSIISGDGREVEDLQAVAKKARIEKLRLNGWAVSKERHGFKGEQYYENLRRVAERELNVCARLHTRI